MAKKILISKLKFKCAIKSVKCIGCIELFIITNRRNLLICLFKNLLHVLSGFVFSLSLGWWVLPRSLLEGLGYWSRSACVLLLDCYFITPFFSLNDFLLFRSKFLHGLFNHFLNLNANNFENILPTWIEPGDWMNLFSFPSCCFRVIVYPSFLPVLHGFPVLLS